jgi:hypothetical protein
MGMIVKVAVPGVTVAVPVIVAVFVLSLGLAVAVSGILLAPCHCAKAIVAPIVEHTSNDAKNRIRMRRPFPVSLEILIT